MRVDTKFTPSQSLTLNSLAKDQPVVLLRMFKALGLHEENIDQNEEEGREEKEKKEGKKEERQGTRIVVLMLSDSWVF